MTSLGLAVVLVLGADGGVEVAVQVKKPLALVKGELRGRVDVVVKNAGPAPVTLQHADVHGFAFAPADGGVPERLFHSCDCGFELGLMPPPDKRTFTLAPSKSQVFTFDDFACGGGPYHAPPRGKYQLSYSLGPAHPFAASDGGLDLGRCEAQVRGRAPAELVSKGVPVTVK